MKPKPILTFDEAEHRYALDGHPVPGVTTVLSKAFGDPWKMVPEASRQYALELGRAVHRWCELDDTGKLTPETMPKGEQMCGYLNAWRKYKADFVTEIVAVEQPIYSVRYQYAGTFDFVAKTIMPHQKPPVLTMIDRKTGVAFHPFYSLQTAAYALAWEELNHPLKINRRVTVLLKADGTYKPEVHTDTTDRNQFLAALSCVAWKNKHNLTMETEI
jgi:hypothetical protein